MPIFGDNMGGTDSFPASNDRCVGSKYTLTETGTVTQINLMTDATGSAGSNGKALIFSDSGGLPGTLLIASTGQAMPAGANDVAFSVTPTVLSPGDYWICAVSDSFEVRWRGDLGGAGGQRKEGYSYASPPSTFGTPDGSTGTTFDFYATYTVGGGSSQAPRSMHQYGFRRK